MDTKILLADDQELLREGLRLLLEEKAHIPVAGIAKTAEEILPALKKTKAGLLILNTAIKGLDAVELIETTGRDFPKVKVLVISHIFGRLHARVMLTAGASGYVLQSGFFGELKEAIEAIESGDIYLCDAIQSLIVQDFTATNGVMKSPPVLKKRDILILQLLADGYSSVEAGRHIGKSTKTIDAERRKIMQKLGINNNAALIKYAIREGITTLEG